MSDLRPNKSLLNNSFNGYKLGKDSLCVKSLPLISSVDGTFTNPNKFSYAYVRSHEMHNHLYLDTWSGNVFFVDSECRVNTIKSDERRLTMMVLQYCKKTGDHLSIYHVYTIPQLEGDVKNDSFGSSMVFPTSNLCVITDGNGSVYIIQTGERKTTLNQQWLSLTDTAVYDLLCPGYILSATLENETNMLHIMAMTLKDMKQEKNASTYVNLLWIQVNISIENPNECQIHEVKAFLGKSPPNACWFSKDFTHLLVATNKQFHLVDQRTFEKIEPLIPIGEDGDKIYKWHQCKEMISISFDFHVTENEVDCTLRHDGVSIKLKNGKVLLDGSLEKHIIPDASKWFVEKNRLEVVLVKKETGTFWISVVPGDMKGLHNIEGEEEEKIKEVHEGLSHLTSGEEEQEATDSHHFNMQQLEECDEISDEEEVKLFSIDAFTGKVEIQKTLGGHQWLFVLQSDPNDAPLICLRHDVDGVIWKPNRNFTLNWQHIATFDALGYVQASKQEHKFTTCNRNFRHASITDCTSNVYVYEADKTNKNQHNQYVPALGNSQKILGCQSTEKHLYVLTNNHLNIVCLP